MAPWPSGLWEDRSIMEEEDSRGTLEALWRGGARRGPSQDTPFKDTPPLPRLPLLSGLFQFWIHQRVMLFIRSEPLWSREAWTQPFWMHTEVWSINSPLNPTTLTDDDRLTLRSKQLSLYLTAEVGVLGMYVSLLRKSSFVMTEIVFET